MNILDTNIALKKEWFEFCDMQSENRRSIMNILLKRVGTKLNEIKHNILDVLFVPFWNR